MDGDGWPGHQTQYGLVLALEQFGCVTLTVYRDADFNNNNNERISRALFHVKHAQLR